jgi:hypothetical protein
MVQCSFYCVEEYVTDHSSQRFQGQPTLLRLVVNCHHVQQSTLQAQQPDVFQHARPDRLRATHQMLAGQVPAKLLLNAH